MGYSDQRQVPRRIGFEEPRTEMTLSTSAGPAGGPSRDEADAEARFYARARRRWRPAAAPGQGGRSGVQICPVCGTRANRFLASGSPPRPNAQCPRCGSVERHRLLRLFLAERTGFFRRRHRVLHTAPEPCFVEPFRARHGRRYVTVDKFDPAADRRADLTALPFATASFDVVLSSHVLEHIADDGAAINEIARVLRPGGWAVVMVPYSPTQPRSLEIGSGTPEQRAALYGHPYHYRVYGPDLVGRLGAAGLDASVHASRDLLSGHRRRRHRINNNFLLFCRRRGSAAAAA